MGFVARYGSTSPAVSRHMTVIDLSNFMDALAEIVEEEKEAMLAVSGRTR